MKFSLRPRPPISLRALTAFVVFCIGTCAHAQDQQVSQSTANPQGVPATEAAAAGHAASSEQAGSVQDGAAGSVLERFIADVHDLSARFEQRDFDADGVLIEQSTGEFLLLRPDRYLWRYETPFEQLIVADGETLSRYEVDLETVTRMPQSEMDSGPATLLSGETAVSDDYLIRELPADDGDQIVELVPFNNDTELRSITIEFHDGVPTRLELIDQLGEPTTIEFSSVTVNAGVDSARFEFTPPRGVDVVDWE